MKSVALVVVLVACGSDRPQIVVSVDTSVGVPCEIDRIRIRAGATEDSVVDKQLADARLPVSFTLEDDTPSGTFDLVVSGLKGTTEVLRAEGSLQFGAGDALAANIVLESSCGPSSPCALPALERFTDAPPPVTRSKCGELVRRYVPGPATETFRDVCTVPGPNTGKVLMTAGATVAQLPLTAAALDSFSFEFYGQPIRQIWVSRDGYLAFTQTNPDPQNDLDAGAFDRDLVGAGVPPPKQGVFPFWDDLTLGADGVCYALEGAPGTQKLRVTWKSACHTLVCSAANNLNFTVVLDERTNRVSLTYGEMLASNPDRAQGSTATVGLVNDALGCPAAKCTYATGLCDDGTTPCGYSQVFSKVPQMPRVQNVEFEPVVDP